MAASSGNQGRKLLFSELFKDPKQLSSDKKKKKPPSPSPSPSPFVAGDIHPNFNSTMIMSSSSCEFGSPGSSLSLTSGSVLGSELGYSTTTDSTTDDEGDNDFIAELTQQMADYMLNDDADDEEILPEKPHQVEEEREFVGKLEKRREQILQNGSGMRAVFLGRSSSRIESLGTGVFLPRGTPLISEPPRRKKSVCSTVLVPARVLQVLQHHFANSNVKPAIIQSNGLTSQYPSQPGVKETRRRYTQQQHEKQPQNQTGEQQQPPEDVFLPKEWIY